MKALLACWLTAIAVLLWLAMPRPASFEKRWPALPPSMSLQVYDAARKAATRPSACVYHYRPHQAAAKTCAVG